MKHRFIKILFVFVAVFSVTFSTAVLADNYGLDIAAKQAGLPSKIAGESTVPGIAGRIFQYGLSFIGIVFFALMLYAGFLWMSAMGNTEKVESAKQILETAIIGLILVLGAYAIARFVFGILQGNP